MKRVSNLRPRVLADLCDAVWKSDLPRARGLHQALLEINQAVFFDTNPIPIKYMMRRLGLAACKRAPLTPTCRQHPNWRSDWTMCSGERACYRTGRMKTFGPSAAPLLLHRVNYPDRNEEYKDGSERPKYPASSSAHILRL